MHIDRIPKFCLDVANNPWRTEIVKKRFQDAGLDVEHFFGVHGQTVGIMPLRTVWDNPDGAGHSYRINPGKTSITVSKLLMFQHILDLGCEEAIIFENDVTFCPNFKEEFERSYNALPADWEACHVGHCCTEGKPQTIINDRVTQICWPLGCHGLMFKRSTLAKAIEVLKLNSWGTPSDTILARKLYPNLNHYSFVPALVSPDGSDSEAAKMEVYTDCQGWTSPCMMKIYDEQLTGFGDNYAKVAEVGCFKGRSTIYLASEVKRRLKNVTIYAIDHWQGNHDEPDMQELIKDANSRGGLYQEFIRNINRCGVSDVIVPMKMPSVEGASHFKDHELDFVYIDAGHSYDDVLADCKAYGPKLKGNTVMAGHDIARSSVRAAVTDYCASIGKKFRVYQESWIIDGMPH